MRAVTLCVVTLLACADATVAQVEGYQILFSSDSITIAEEDQRAILDLLGFSISGDGTALEAMDCGAIYAPQVTEDDLNGDGIVEVFVLAGNSCTSGAAGSNLSLFIKNAEGSWETNLGFPAGGWAKLDSSNLGFPDLSIGGPGFCEAVWRWDGTTYQHHGNRETEPGGCEGIG